MRPRKGARSSVMDVHALAAQRGLDALLSALNDLGGYTLVDHWQQGEFHHDLVLTLKAGRVDGAGVLLVATNCNGGVKEVLALEETPDRWGLWHHRCPGNPEFWGPAPRVVARAVTQHWFDPRELLVPDARSELSVVCRRRARGGGWEPA